MTTRLTLFLVFFMLFGNWTQPPQATENEVACVIQFASFIPGLKKSVERKTTVNSPIREAAFQVLAKQMKNGIVTVSARKDLKKEGINESFVVEPRKGSILIDGITWKWNVTSTLGPVIIDDQIRPVVAKFRVTLRLTLITESLMPQIQLIQATSNGWFYMVDGAGKKQDGRLLPRKPATNKEGRKGVGSS